MNPEPHADYGACSECGCPYDWRAAIGVASAERAQAEALADALDFVLLTDGQNEEARQQAHAAIVAFRHGKMMVGRWPKKAGEDTVEL